MADSLHSLKNSLPTEPSVYVWELHCPRESTRKWESPKAVSSQSRCLAYKSTTSPNIYEMTWISAFMWITVMCYRSRLMATTERKLQQAMNTLETWSTENIFRFSQNKTTCVHFCRQRECKEKPSLFLQNTELPVKQEVKFLEMFYDRILSFKPHIEYLRRKCQKAMNLLKVLSGVEWGADRDLTVYKAYIQSRLDYGSIVYNSACKSCLDRLNPVQNRHHQQSVCM